MSNFCVEGCLQSVEGCSQPEYSNGVIARVVSNPRHGFDTLHSALDTQLDIKIHGCKDFDGTKLEQRQEEVG